MQPKPASASSRRGLVARHQAGQSTAPTGCPCQLPGTRRSRGAPLPGAIQAPEDLVGHAAVAVGGTSTRRADASPGAGTHNQRTFPGSTETSALSLLPSGETYSPWTCRLVGPSLFPAPHPPGPQAAGTGWGRAGTRYRQAHWHPCRRSEPGPGLLKASPEAGHRHCAGPRFTQVLPTGGLESRALADESVPERQIPRTGG